MYLALVYHFYREHFSANVADIRWINGKYNLADAMTKALGTMEFQTCIGETMMNN